MYSKEISPLLTFSMPENCNNVFSKGPHRGNCNSGLCFVSEFHLGKNRGQTVMFTNKSNWCCKMGDANSVANLHRRCLLMKNNNNTKTRGIREPKNKNYEPQQKEGG